MHEQDHLEEHLLKFRPTLRLIKSPLMKLKVAVMRWSIITSEWSNFNRKKRAGGYFSTDLPLEIHRYRLKNGKNINKEYIDMYGVEWVTTLVKKALYGIRLTAHSYNKMLYMNSKYIYSGELGRMVRNRQRRKNRISYNEYFGSTNLTEAIIYSDEILKIIKKRFSKLKN